MIYQTLSDVFDEAASAYLQDAVKFSNKAEVFVCNARKSLEEAAKAFEESNKDVFSENLIAYEQNMKNFYDYRELVKKFVDDAKTANARALALSHGETSPCNKM